MLISGAWVLNVVRDLLDFYDCECFLGGKSRFFPTIACEWTVFVRLPKEKGMEEGLRIDLRKGLKKNVCFPSEKEDNSSLFETISIHFFGSFLHLHFCRDEVFTKTKDQYHFIEGFLKLNPVVRKMCESNAIDWNAAIRLILTAEEK